MKTLAELLEQYMSAEIADQILADLAVQSPALPTTAWQPGSVPRTLVAVFADSEANLYAGRYSVSSGGYLSLSSGDWLTLLASELFGVERDDAVNTQGLVQFTDAGGGPHAITGGTTTVASGTRTYVATTGGTLPLNSSVFVPVRASVAGIAGNVANGAITTLVTALAGVSVSNVVPWISRIGTAAVTTRGWIKLTNAAGGSTAAGTVSVNDGAGHTYTNVNAVTLVAGVQQEVLFEAALAGTDYNVGNGLITTVAADGTLPGATTCVNTVPSVNVTSWITTAGSEEQSDDSLRGECRNVLLARGVDWTSAGIELLVSEAPISSGTDITRVLVVANPAGVAGKIGVWIASEAGAVTAGDVSDVQAYLNTNRSMCATAEVRSASELSVVVAGAVSVPASFLAQAQASAAANLAGLAAQTPIGGDPDAGNAVQLEDVIAAIKAASYDASGRNTNTASPTQIGLTLPAADVPLASDQVPTFDTSGITWTGV